MSTLKATGDCQTPGMSPPAAPQPASACVNGCSGSCGSAVQRPYNTQPPRSWTTRANSAASRVLPMPRRPATKTTPPWPWAARVQAASQPGQLGGPAHKGGPDRLQRLGQLPGWGRLGRRREVQPRILGEDRRLQPAQLRPRVDAQLLDQDRPGPLIGQQRVGLPTGAVQGQHELGPQPLPQRLLPDQPLQLGHQLPMPPQPQVRLDPILQRDQPQLGQPIGLGRARRRCPGTPRTPGPATAPAPRAASRPRCSASPSESARRPVAVSSSKRVASSAPGATRSR